jgi:hypothetical protein
MDDNMPSGDSKESSINGVLVNRSIVDALSEVVAGFKSPEAKTNDQLNNVDDACDDDDDTIAHTKTQFQKLKEQKETERDVFKMGLVQTNHSIYGISNLYWKQLNPLT